MNRQRRIFVIFLALALCAGRCFAETDESAHIRNADAVHTYLEFLCGGVPVRTADGFPLGDTAENAAPFPAGEYTYDELKDAVAAYESREATAQYALVDFGQDGVYELALLFENTEKSLLNFVGVIRYDSEGLVLQGFYEDGYRTQSALYTSGHLWLGGSMGAGAHGFTLYSFDGNGVGARKFACNEYEGVFAAMIAYDLPGGALPDAQGDLPAESRLFVREYIADDGIAISAERYSAQSDVCAREKALIDALISRGARLISTDDMDALTALAPYAEAEVVWHAWEGDPTSFPVDAYVSHADVTAAYAPDALLLDPQSHLLFEADDSEYAVDVLLNARRMVTDFRVVPLADTGALDTGRISMDAPSIFALDALSPETPLVLRVSFPGDMPRMGVLYIDFDGVARAYAIEMSGRDGSLLLTELNPE